MKYGFMWMVDSENGSRIFIWMSFGQWCLGRMSWGEKIKWEMNLDNMNGIDSDHYSYFFTWHWAFWLYIRDLSQTGPVTTCLLSVCSLFVLVSLSVVFLCYSSLFTLCSSKVLLSLVMSDSFLFAVLTKWVQMRTCKRTYWTTLTFAWATVPASRAMWLQLQGSLMVVPAHSSVFLSIFLDWAVDPFSLPN